MGVYANPWGVPAAALSCRNQAAAWRDRSYAMYSEKCLRQACAEPAPRMKKTGGTGGGLEGGGGCLLCAERFNAKRAPTWHQMKRQVKRSWAVSPRPPRPTAPGFSILGQGARRAAWSACDETRSRRAAWHQPAPARPAPTATRPSASSFICIGTVRVRLLPPCLRLVCSPGQRPEAAPSLLAFPAFRGARSIQGPDIRGVSARGRPTDR